MRYVDVTPTWREILPTLLALYEDGTCVGRMSALNELQRMADIADMTVKAIRDNPDVINDD